jgi:hypothetical protein
MSTLRSQLMVRSAPGGSSGRCLWIIRKTTESSSRSARQANALPQSLDYEWYSLPGEPQEVSYCSTEKVRKALFPDTGQNREGY